MNMIYKVCKRIIERSNYSKNMIPRIKVFYDAKLISEKEYNELMTMLNN